MLYLKNCERVKKIHRCGLLAVLAKPTSRRMLNSGSSKRRGFPGENKHDSARLAQSCLCNRPQLICVGVRRPVAGNVVVERILLQRSVLQRLGWRCIVWPINDM